MPAIKKTKKVLIAAISVVLTAAMLAGASYAWFTFGTVTTGMVLETGFLDSLVTVYAGRDFDFDGVLDVDQNRNKIFANIGDTSIEGNVITIQAQDFFPSQVKTWKLEVTNKGNIKGIASVNLNYTGISEFKVLSVIINGTKHYLGNYNGVYEMMGSVGIENNASAALEFQIEFETYESLTAAGISITLEEYQNISGKNITIPKIIVDLEST